MALNLDCLRLIVRYCYNDRLTLHSLLLTNRALFLEAAVVLYRDPFNAEKDCRHAFINPDRQDLMDDTGPRPSGAPAAFVHNPKSTYGGLSKFAKCRLEYLLLLSDGYFAKHDFVLQTERQICGKQNSSDISDNEGGNSEPSPPEQPEQLEQVQLPRDWVFYLPLEHWGPAPLPLRTTTTIHYYSLVKHMPSDARYTSAPHFNSFWVLEPRFGRLDYIMNHSSQKIVFLELCFWDLAKIHNFAKVFPVLEQISISVMAVTSAVHVNPTQPRGGIVTSTHGGGALTSSAGGVLSGPLRQELEEWSLKFIQDHRNLFPGKLKAVSFMGAKAAQGQCWRWALDLWGLGTVSDEALAEQEKEITTRVNSLLQSASTPPSHLVPASPVTLIPLQCLDLCEPIGNNNHHFLGEALIRIADSFQNPFTTSPYFMRREQLKRINPVRSIWLNQECGDEIVVTGTSHFLATAQNLERLEYWGRHGGSAASDSVLAWARRAFDQGHGRPPPVSDDENEKKATGTASSEAAALHLPSPPDSPTMSASQPSNHRQLALLPNLKVLIVEDPVVTFQDGLYAFRNTLEEVRYVNNDMGFGLFDDNFGDSTTLEWSWPVPNLRALAFSDCDWDFATLQHQYLPKLRRLVLERVSGPTWLTTSLSQPTPVPPPPPPPANVTTGPEPTVQIATTLEQTAVPTSVQPSPPALPATFSWQNFPTRLTHLTLIGPQQFNMFSSYNGLFTLFKLRNQLEEISFTGSFVISATTEQRHKILTDHIQQLKLAWKNARKEMNVDNDAVPFPQLKRVELQGRWSELFVHDQILNNWAPNLESLTISIHTDWARYWEELEEAMQYRQYKEKRECTEKVDLEGLGEFWTMSSIDGDGLDCCFGHDGEADVVTDKEQLKPQIKTSSGGQQLTSLTIILQSNVNQSATLGRLFGRQYNQQGQLRNNEVSRESHRILTYPRLEYLCLKTDGIRQVHRRLHLGTFLNAKELVLNLREAIVGQNTTGLVANVKDRTTATKKAMTTRMPNLRKVVIEELRVGAMSDLIHKRENWKSIAKQNPVPGRGRHGCVLEFGSSTYGLL